ncbi:hemerythrin domain-containing protein [Kitasatospora sp. NPDC052868]|uniref:hemerythrin domain-containing protein n=1 Tax=Kitasatospora sp. NPDC052868 TaxID=3364060 RepID=UPI0037CC6101
MSRRPDILGEFTADHRAVTELLARIEGGTEAGPGAAALPEGPAAAAAGPGGTAAAAGEATGPEAAAPVAGAPAADDAPADAGAGADGRGELLAQLTDLLFSHCAAEEEHLFPVVQHDVPEGGALVFASIHEHLAIGQYLSDLQGLAANDPAFDTLVQGLAETVRRHLTAEEKALFPAARKALPAAARAALGERLRAERAAAEPAGPGS